MAKTPKSSGGTSFEERPEAVTLPDEEHPDYVAGQIADGEGSDAGTSEFGFDANISPSPAPGPLPLPGPLPRPFPFPTFCSPVSGRYRYVPLPKQPSVPTIPAPVPGRPIIPLRAASETTFGPNNSGARSRTADNTASGPRADHSDQPAVHNGACRCRPFSAAKPDFDRMAQAVPQSAGPRDRRGQIR